MKGFSGVFTVRGPIKNLEKHARKRRFASLRPDRTSCVTTIPVHSGEDLGLVWPYAALTLQVLNSHGRSALEEWHQTARIDWISVAAVIGILLVLALLFVDWRERRTPTAPTAWP